MTAAAVIIARERHIVAAFEGAGATAPERAVDPEVIGVSRGLVFQKLERRAILRESDTGRFYLDLAAWTATRRLQRRLALVMVGIVILVAIAAVIATLVVNR